jgi:hypothetical protein
MNLSFEEIFDQALLELRQGKTIDEVVLAYPEHAELRGLLEVVSLAQSVPTNVVPTPLRRRKFAEKVHQSWWLNTVGLLKFGIMPLTLVMMVLGARTLVSRAQHSLPNDNLYTLKRASEQLQLTFTRDSGQQASFQVELTQRRLDEVKQAAANQNPAQEAAALAELKDQSQKTFATLPQVAAATAIANKDSSLLNSLVAINKQQQEVLNSIQPQEATKDITATSLSSAKETEKTLLALVATVHEQTLTDLDNKVSASGEASLSADKNEITVDKVEFLIVASTLITTESGQQIALASLPNHFAADIVGTKIDNVLTASVITVEDGEQAVPTEEQQPAPGTTEPASEEQPASSPDQNEVTAGVIAEPASQQYLP